MSEVGRFGKRWLIFMLVLVVAGCNSDSGSGASRTDSGGVARSALARDTNPSAADADVKAVTAGNTAFALKAFPLLDPDGDANIVFSPYSITQALALTAAGAKGKTLSGIEKAMAFPLPQGSLNPAFNKLDLLLAAKTVGVIQDDIGQTPRLRIVNAIWGQQGFPLLSSYLDTIALNFGAELRLADFRHAAEAARLIINAWAEEQTNQRIKDLLAKGSIDADTRVVLTNAVWFKANWASPFAAGQTRDRPFIDRSGMPKAVPFMSQTYWVPYGRSKACQAVDIPYTEGKISMMVIMPDVGTFDAFLTAFTPAVLDEIIGKLDTQYVALSMPKFTFSATPPIGSTLRTLGMAEAFDPFEADFSGIDGKRDLFIGNVVHQAFISVDEKGTEAAAATAVSLSTVSLPPPPLPLAVDHPFIFLIRDRETGLILFIGKVVAL